MRSLKWLIFPLPAVLPIEQLPAQDVEWSLDVLIGDAHNFPTRTHIDHEALGENSLAGDYDTRGLEGPLHYTWRVSRSVDDRAWELQLLHHKLFLTNRPGGVDSLSVSHGFNIITLNRAFELDGWKLRIGVGPVIAHPEARISGLRYDGPYELGGAAVLAGIGRSFELSQHWTAIAEASTTFGYIEVSPSGPSNLELTIRNLAVHAQVGVGYRF